MVIAVVVMMAAVVSVLVSKGNGSGRIRLCESNLKQLGTAFASYGADFQQHFPTFSWSAESGGAEGDSAFTPPYRDHVTAGARQALSLIQRRGGRTDVGPIDGWLPHALYSPLMLHDYVASRLPDGWQACTEDRLLLLWQDTVRGPVRMAGPEEHVKSRYIYDRTPLEARAAILALPANQRPTHMDDNAVQRIAYSSSYALVAAAYSPDRRGEGVSTVQSALRDHSTYTIGNAPLGRRIQDEIAYPSNKVLMYDQFARHCGKRVLWYAYPEAEQPLLFADNSVRVERTGDANPGFYPNAPESRLPLRYWYVPRAFEPPTRTGTPNELMTGSYAWTRGGLKGRDYPEK